MELFIYVIAESESGPCKLGFSQAPEKRVKQLQTGHFAALKVYHQHAFQKDRVQKIEKIIHKTLGHKRKKGEWFDLTVEEAILEVEYASIRWDD